MNCGETHGLTIDHIIPVDSGGTDDISNLQTLCYPCNHAKGNTIPLTKFEKIKLIWNIDVRLQVLKKMLSSEFTVALRDKADKKDIEQRFKKEISDLKNGSNGALINEKKATAIRFLELERKVNEIGFAVGEVENAFVGLLDFLGIEVGEHGFKNKGDE